MVGCGFELPECKLLKLSPYMENFNNQFLITYITRTAFDIGNVLMYVSNISKEYENSQSYTTFLDVFCESKNEIFEFLRLSYHICLGGISLESILCEKKILRDWIMSLIVKRSEKEKISEKKEIELLTEKLEQMNKEYKILEKREELYVGCMNKYVNRLVKLLKDWQLFYADFVSRYSKMMSEIES